MPAHTLSVLELNPPQNIRKEANLVHRADPTGTGIVSLYKDVLVVGQILEVHGKILAPSLSVGPYPNLKIQPEVGAEFFGKGFVLLQHFLARQL